MSTVKKENVVGPISLYGLITVEQQIGNDLERSLQIVQLHGLQNYLIAFTMSAKGYMKAILAIYNANLKAERYRVL